MLAFVALSLLAAACGGSSAPDSQAIPTADPDAVAPASPTTSPSGEEPASETPATEPDQGPDTDTQRPEVTEVDEAFSPIEGNDDEIADVMAAYLAGVEAVTASGQPPNPEFPGLQTLGDPLRSRVTEVRAAAAARGDTAAGQVDRHTRLTVLNAVQANVRVCSLDGVERYNSDGDVISPAGTEYKVTIGWLRPADSGWELFDIVGNGELCDPDNF